MTISVFMIQNLRRRIVPGSRAIFEVQNREAATPAFAKSWLRE